jgi:hypothetical protein
MEGYLITTAVAVVIFFLCVLLEDWARRTFNRKWRKEQVDMINPDKVRRDCCDYNRLCVFMIEGKTGMTECCLFEKFVLLYVKKPWGYTYKDFFEGKEIDPTYLERSKLCKKVKP